MEILAENKKAFFDYEILEKFQAGLELLGNEVKSIKNKRVSIVGGRVLIRGGEAFAIGLNIQQYQVGDQASVIKTQNNDNQHRTIRLLLKKSEINYLNGKTTQKGLTIVPIKLYNIKNKIKMEIGLAKGKKSFDKREVIKKREGEREVRRTLKGE